MVTPRVTFGIIVLNGEPFTRYCLRSLYPFAHEIIVVEGACRGAEEIATPDGHSKDGTLKTLYRFKEEEDVDDKLMIVTRDGFWDGKDEQSQAYADRATGEYLWQVDIDEFYRHEDMVKVFDVLRSDPSITAVSFRQITFFGDLGYTCDSVYLRIGAGVYHRVFRYGRGYKYVTHRPPTVVDPSGQDLREIKYLDGEELAGDGIYLYHYSLLFPRQVEDKVTYYKRYLEDIGSSRAEGITRWFRDNYLRIADPYHVHNVYSYPGWIERFQGPHPEEIVRMMSDIREGRIRCRLRDNQDIEELLSNKLYHQGVVAIKEGVDLAIRDQYLYMASQEERIRGLIKFGEECRRKGRLDEAIRAYQKAILLRPKNKDILVSIHYGVGSVYKEMGMLDEAKNKFNTVLELIASFPIENKRIFIGGANFHLGHIYQIEGRRKMAKAHFERCLHFIPHHAKAEELLKGL